jgi:DNA processing protein
MKFEIQYEGNRSLLDEKMNLGIYATRSATNYSMEVAQSVVTKFHSDYVFYISFWNLKKLKLNYSQAYFVIVHDYISWKNKISQSNILNLKILNTPNLSPRTDYLFLDLFISQKVRNVLILEATKFSKNLEIISSYCGERGLNVFCLPGKITDKTSEGTNKMIFNGAIPFYSLDLLNV